MRTAAAGLLVAATALVLGGCGSPGVANPNDAAGAAAATVTAAPPTVPPPAVEAAPAGPSSWAMPDLVGTNLQAAQDAVQALSADGIFYTSSHDVTGAGRQQVLDRNWKVCSQNVKPGATITADSRIDFGAAKLTESC